MFRYNVGGVVLRPSAFEPLRAEQDSGVWCAFPSDPHTFGRRCEPPGRSATCIPGCQQAGGQRCAWCASPGCESWGGCAFRPTELAQMAAIAAGGGNYNELVLSAARWEAGLPFTIEAFFVLATDECRASSECGALARRAHARFAEDYLPSAPRAWPRGRGGPEQAVQQQQQQDDDAVELGLPAGYAPLLVLDPYDWGAPFAPAA